MNGNEFMDFWAWLKEYHSMEIYNNMTAEKVRKYYSDYLLWKGVKQ